MDKPPQTPQAELEVIKRAQQRELTWYQDTPSYETTADVARAVEGGTLTAVPDFPGYSYRLSAKIRPEFRYLTSSANQLLNRVAEEWLEKMQAGGDAAEKIFLVVSSLTRSVEFQHELEAKGFPAVEGDTSTHTKGGAFDISIEGFLKHGNQEAIVVLKAVLQELAHQGLLNFFAEPSIKVLHVAVHPDYQDLL